MRTAFNKLIVCLTAIIFMLSFSISVAYASWNGFGSAKSEIFLGVQVGGLGSTSSLLDRLPKNTPADVREKLEKLLETESVYVVDALIDAVCGVVDTPAYSDYISVASDIDGLFEVGAKPILPGAILIYTIDTDEGVEYVIIHVRSDTWRNINSVDELYNAISDPWSNVNMVSTVWMQGNRYTPIHSPIEYNQKYYLLWHEGGVGSPPDVNNGWFELPKNYEYIERNADKYFIGSIVSHNGQYYYSISGGSQEPSDFSWKWQKIPQYESRSYGRGERVYVTSGSDVSFWLALKPTTAEPNETSATNGEWRRIEKGWIGSTNDTTLKTFYYNFNTYDAQDIVIFGVSPKLHYQYFRAKRNVPSGQLPIITNDGIKVVNDLYWEYVYYDGHL